MADAERRIGRFELHQLLDDSHVGRFERGIDTTTREAVVVETVSGSPASLSSFVDQARLADRLGMAPRARLVAAGVVGDRAYAAYRIPEGARSLASVIDGENGAPL